MSPETNSLLESLGVVFRYLGWVFHEIPADSQVVNQILQDVLADRSLGEGNELTRTGLRLLQDHLASWEPDTHQILVVDFNRLFVGPGRLLAPPWESVHRGLERLLFGQHTLDVRHFYARFGLEIPGRGHEPEDHLGFEFMFMAHLCELGCEAEQSGNPERARAMGQARREFLEEHMLPWIPGCMNLVRQHARGTYYQGLAYLAEGCLEQAAVLI